MSRIGYQSLPQSSGVQCPPTPRLKGSNIRVSKFIRESNSKANIYWALTLDGKMMCIHTSKWKGCLYTRIQESTFAQISNFMEEFVLHWRTVTMQSSHFAEHISATAYFDLFSYYYYFRCKICSEVNWAWYTKMIHCMFRWRTRVITENWWDNDDACDGEAGEEPQHREHHVGRRKGAGDTKQHSRHIWHQQHDPSAIPLENQDVSVPRFIQ